MWLLLTSLAIAAIGFRRSPVLGIGLAASFFLLTDTLFQGLSLTLGISTGLGLLGVLATLVVSRRVPRYTWAAAGSAGVPYAVTAKLFVPMELAILTGVLVMSPALTGRQDPHRVLVLGAGASVAWIVAYGLAMVSRLLWVAAVLGGSSTVANTAPAV